MESGLLKASAERDITQPPEEKLDFDEDTLKGEKSIHL